VSAKQPGFVDPMKATPEDLRHAYRLLLGREPDLDPVEYLRTLLDYSGTVEVLHRARSNIVCRDVKSILREWQSVDDEFEMCGAMHIDLYAPGPGR